jgi:hypothetical protein
MNSETRICDTCNKEKIKQKDFSLRREKGNESYRYTCKQCRCVKEKNRVKLSSSLKKCTICNNIKNITEYSNIKKQDDKVILSSKCNSCREELLKYQQDWRDNNQEHIKVNYENNKEYVLEKCKEYRENNKEKVKQFKHDYYQKDENKIHRNEKDKKRREEDYVYKITSNLRTRVHSVLKYNKKDSTNILIGCKKSELVKWIEDQFDSNHNWDNYGSVWHVDHVIPLAFFDFTNRHEQFLALNWSNLRPLDVAKNLSKNDSIVKNDILNHMKTLEQFTSLNSEYETSMETCWWRRVELRYRNNLQVGESFEDFLKRAIRSEDPQPSTAPKKYKAKLKVDNVQRLNGSG